MGTILGNDLGLDPASCLSMQLTVGPQPWLRSFYLSTCQFILNPFNINRKCLSLHVSPPQVLSADKNAVSFKSGLCHGVNHTLPFLLIMKRCWELMRMCLGIFSALFIIRQWVCIAVHPQAGQHCHLMSHWPRPTAIFCSRAAHLMLAQAASTDPSVHTMCSGGQPDRVATVQPTGILNHPGSGGLSEKNLSFGSWISCFSLGLSLVLHLPG